MKLAARLSVGILLLSALLDHFGLFGYLGNDWRRFDHATVIVQHVQDDGSFVIDQSGTIVRLLGVSSPDAKYLRDQLEGRSIILRLDVPQTRDDRGRLLAYVYLNASDCFNVQIVANGWASADGSINHPMRSVIAAAEGQARKKGRGFWAGSSVSRKKP